MSINTKQLRLRGLTMNIAQKIIQYYESEDFRNNYLDILLEDIENAKYQINEMYRTVQWDVYFGDFRLTEEQQLTLIDFMRENHDEFLGTFSGYYVGELVVDSVSFGEQCEQLTDITNHRTNKPYTKRYLKYIFDKEGFTVDKKVEYAYYDMSGEGLYLTLRNTTLEQLKDIINEA